jgi:predicted DsbA family dithiol-disulfide isomerase
VRIDIWSDVICPWCWLGKRRFEAALAQLDWADEVEVRWRAFLLDPAATTEPGDLRATLERKYGPGAFDSMTSRLAALGADVGIDYRFDLAKRVGTVDAHRLLAWAWDAGGAASQDALQERLFRAYFTEGANVAEHDTLVRLAGDAGLDHSTATEFLRSGAHAAEVAADLREAADRQLTGVPAFLVGGRALVPGAQDAETFRLVLEQVRSKLSVDATAGAGDACAVDDPRC